MVYDVGASAPDNGMYNVLDEAPANTVVTTSRTRGGIKVALNIITPSSNEQGGAFKSMRDLDGALMYIYARADGRTVPSEGLELKPEFVSLRFHNGRRVNLGTASIEQRVKDTHQSYGATIHLPKN